jgi:hypothetical protein
MMYPFFCWKYFINSSNSFTTLFYYCVPHSFTWPIPMFLPTHLLASKTGESKAASAVGATAGCKRDTKVSRQAMMGLTLLGALAILTCWAGRSGSHVDFSAWLSTPRPAISHRVLEMGAHGGPATASAARADLQAVLAGTWSAVDLGPLDAMSAALTSHLNSSNGLEGHSAQLVIERKIYYALAAMPSVRTICEIGFNGGHSAALWLHGKGASVFFSWPAVAL